MKKVLFLLFWVTLASGCEKKETVGSYFPEEDPFNLVYSVEMKAAKILTINTEKLNRDAFYTEKSMPKDRNSEESDTNIITDKVHPLLRKKLIKGENPIETLVLVFKDNYKIPRFPEPNIKEPRSSVYNKSAIEEAEKLIRKITQDRSENFRRLEEVLARTYQAKIVERFWLINGIVIEMPLRTIIELEKREDLLSIEPQLTEDSPPQNSNPNDDVDDGRARLVSDPYFNLGLSSGWIGLLDTGVRPGHSQFNNPDHIDFMRDCVNGGANCNTGTINPNDDCWNHGTSSAAIITANATQGNRYRGVTSIILDNFKVYPSTFDNNGNCSGFLNTTAAVRGFQRAVAVLDRVIVAEMQGSGGSGSAISVAADNAFDAGAVIIAANGNNGPNASTVNVPANAHKVIGVGNFDVQTGNQVNSQSRGPASDNRFKPDIQAPTNTETASNANNTALRVFSGTSGATPYAAGAAALLRNWLRGNNFSIDPGQVYAQLMLSGQQPYPFNNTSGAGSLRLPTDGLAWWGKVSVSNGQVVDIPLTINSSTANLFDGALWWPETEGGTHNDVDLSFVDPSGNVVTSSLSIPSVFERIRRNGSVARGNWKLRIRGYNVNGNQTVYWAAHVRQ